MRKTFEVREYDSIICENTNRFAKGYRQMPKADFLRLEEFIRTHVPEDGGAGAFDFMDISCNRRGVGDIVHVKNYVGVIQIPDGCQIEILPKLPLDDGGKDKSREVFVKMLRSVKDFPYKAFQRTTLAVDRMNLYEIFIRMYLSEVRELTKRGLKSTYIRREGNLGYYKGKLMVNEHIKQNLVHRERFYMSYDEYQVNRPENRLIKAALMKLQRRTGENTNSREIRQLLSHFELVDASVNYQKDFSQVAIDRSTKEYEIVMQWSKVFLLNKSFTPFSGEESAGALLFPMEKVFEAYVADHMRHIMRGSGWSVATQDRGHYLFTAQRALSSGESPARLFALRPDIVMRKEKHPPVVLDTKWKRLQKKPGKNYGISQADMYQMYAYAKKYHTSEVWLLYPKTEGMEGMNGFTFDSGDAVNVHLFFVDVARIDESLEELKAMIVRETGR